VKNHTYRRNLRHIQPPEGTFFITYRLFGSIPKPVIQKMKVGHEMAIREIDLEFSSDQNTDDGKQKRQVANKRYFKKFDDFLDANVLNAPHWLMQPNVAKFELNNIQYYAQRYFELHTACIMSNHVHLLLTMKPNAPMLWKVMRDMKKYSSRHIKQMLDLQGQFWENESYDHVVRSTEFERIFYYILNNPVKAKVVKEWSDYPYTYVCPKLKM